MKRKLCLFSILLSALTTLGCGKWADAKNQKVESIEIPEYPKSSDSVYNLQPSIPSIGYGGTLVIFNENIAPIDLADLLQASIDSRIAWAESRVFSDTTDYAKKYAEGGIYSRAIKDMKSELAAFENKEKSRISLSEEIQTQAAESWLNDELQLLFPEDQNKRFESRTVFNKYCEAKIWELFSNSYFADNLYSERPTPNAICEPYYKEEQFFAGEECEQSEDGKNYFNCMWNQGVKKTSFYQDYTDNQKVQIEALISSETINAIQNIVSLSDSSFTFPRPIYKNKTIGKNKENRTYFSDLILKQEKGSKLCEAIIPNEKEFCSVFQQSYNIDQLSNLTMSPLNYISMMEGSNAEKSSLFPLPLRPQSSFSTKQMLFYLSSRINHNNSESDRFFHKIISGRKLEKPLSTDEIIASKASEIEASLSGKFYPQLSGPTLKEYKLRSRQISDLEKEFNLKTNLYSDLNQKITDSSDRAFKIGNRKNVAHALMEIRLKVSNREGVLRTYFWVKDFENTVTLGCTNMKTKKDFSSSCLPHLADNISAENINSANFLKVDSNTGLVELEIPLKNSTEIGFVQKSRVPQNEGVADSFSDFSNEFYKDKSLYFELFPNSVFNSMEILTGKAFLRTAGVNIEESAVSLWDQNL